jgi:hypothetical protein
VEEIATSATDEAARISAMEAAASSAEETRKVLDEPAQLSGSTSGPAIKDAETGEAGTDRPNTELHPSASEARP